MVRNREHAALELLLRFMLMLSGSLLQSSAFVQGFVFFLSAIRRQALVPLADMVRVATSAFVVTPDSPELIRLAD